MKYILLILVIIVATPLYSADLITIKTVNGKVEIKEPGKAWVKAEKGGIIPEGSVISTGFKSNAELDLSGFINCFHKTAYQNVCRQTCNKRKQGKYKAEPQAGKNKG